MSRLALAMHTPPPGTQLTRQDAELRSLQIDMAHYEQCKRAFYQAPSPRLGAALRQLEASIEYRKQICSKKGWL